MLKPRVNTHRQCSLIGGHSWVAVGGRSCPRDNVKCSQPVYECSLCGAFDYGELGGPAEKECRNCNISIEE